MHRADACLHLHIRTENYIVQMGSSINLTRSQEHRGDLKICQKKPIGGRKGQNYGTLKWPHRSKKKVFWAWETYNKQPTIEEKKWGYVIKFGHTEALL